ncbi:MULTISPECIES: hypothetical protein [Luteimonas]|uniref:hypothetical protein n=1 Tax=Luteimonas TaxID=83614 RepID=UPI000C7AA898|nr:MULTISPECIES: hypothetical protein [Luteimonas]
MRVAVLVLAVSAALALSGCHKLLPGSGDAAAAADAPGAATPIALDGSVAGEITSSSGLNYSDGRRHQLHTLALSEDQAVTLRLDRPLAGAR